MKLRDDPDFPECVAIVGVALIWAALLAAFVVLLPGCAVGRTAEGGVVIGVNPGDPLPEGASQLAGAIGGTLFGPVGASVGAGVVALGGLLVKRHGDAAFQKGKNIATQEEWAAASDHYNPRPKPSEKA